ncbi:hypothetical protein [Streptomyces sp. NPDC007083]|uniref:hypothetical protein n=1 Tax=unclassified Streptomyces TaxID=2593676 RepID=UPI0034018B3F
MGRRPGAPAPYPVCTATAPICGRRALPGGIGSTHLDLLWGAADDHGTMVRVLERALSRLGHEFRFKDGSIGTVHSRLTAPFPAVLCGPARPPEPEDGAPCGAVPAAG